MVSLARSLMGGQVAVHVVPGDAFDAHGHFAGPHAAADPDAVLDRIARWADRLTRFTATSELSRLNANARVEVAVGPTLAAVLDWGREAEVLTDGIVDVGLLDERIAAEGRPETAAHRAGSTPSRSLASRRWSLDRRARGAVVRRPAGLRFDLDGIAKGWIADRALTSLDGHAAAVVDADGDIAIRLGRGVEWTFGVADPHHTGHDLVELRLRRREGVTDRDEPSSRRAADRFGLATSGTSVHRWDRAGGHAHHLIDPRTGRSAVTDLVQATVLAGSARVAEALAKAAVIVGSEAAFALLDRAGVDGAILLTDRGRLLIHPATLRWLA
ncbi:MAG TPA: FAD:protein FMN transferase [Candidatus Limnocylindrales bacterium]|nr:FAD:protein FMN transferase [Candidatus Limnocylindrales bacterium]